MSDLGLSALLLSYLWAGWSGSGRLAPKLSTPSTGSPRSGLTRQTLSWPSIFRSGFRPLGSGRFRADHGTGRWRRIVFEDPDGALGEVMPVPIGRDLQATAQKADGVVQPGDTLLLDAQDVVEFAHERNEGRAFLRGGHGEAGVVLLDIDVRQPAIGRLDRRDPVRPSAAEAGASATCPRAALSANRLRAVGGDVRDVQLLQRPPHLRQKRLVDLRARLRREEVRSGCPGRCRTTRTDHERGSSPTARESSRPCPPPHIEKSK